MAKRCRLSCGGRGAVGHTTALRPPARPYPQPDPDGLFVATIRLLASLSAPRSHSVPSLTRTPPSLPCPPPLPLPSPLQPRVLFFVGTQTGTAQGFAEALARDAPKHGFGAEIVDLDTFSDRNPAEQAAARAKVKAASAACDAFERAGKTGAPPTLAVFLVATYGEGDPTENAADFVKFLKAEAAAAGAGAGAGAGGAATTNTFRGLRYAVFGLGNRQYEHFNKMGRDLDAGLDAAGAVRVYARGEGDDDGSMEADFGAWRGGLWGALSAAAGASAATAAAGPAAAGSGAGATGASASASSPPELPWKAVLLPPAKAAAAAAAAGRARAPSSSAAVDAAGRNSKQYYLSVPARVVANRELRPSPGVGNSTRHVELDLAGAGLTYRTADNLFVCPENEPDLVRAVADRFKLDLDQCFALEPAAAGGKGAGGGKLPPTLFPTPTTVRTALARYCSLAGKVERTTLEQLIPYAADPRERARLEYLVSPAGMPAFDAWATRPQRSVAEALLGDFKSVSLDLAALLHVLPRLQARAYTIASSSAVNPGVASIVASVLDAPKPAEDGSSSSGGGSGGDASSSTRRLRGVCTNDILRTPVGGEMHVYVKESTFRMPADPRVPIILVGPGTGIAPMMAFLQERRKQRADAGKAAAAAAAAVGDTVLFFGCRRAEEDFIYERELKGYAADRTLTGLHIAFSRDGPNKVYVQNLLREEGKAVWGYLSGAESRPAAHVYVCGATRMGHDVLEALEAVRRRETVGGAREGGGGVCLLPHCSSALSPHSLPSPSLSLYSAQVVAEHGKLSPAEASKYVKRMQEDHRYVQELWSST